MFFPAVVLTLLQGVAAHLHEEVFVAFRTLQLACALSLVFLVSCASDDEAFILDVQAMAPATTPASGEDSGEDSGEGSAAGSEERSKEDPVLSAVVKPFEDARSETGQVGVHTHRGGSESSIYFLDGEPSEVVTRLMTDYLNHSGWRARALQPHEMDGVVSGDGTDVIMGGKVLVLTVDIKRSYGFTDIKVLTKTLVEARNTADGSVLRMTVNSAGNQTVFWFETEDAQQLVSETLSESFGQFLADTEVQGNLLGLK